MDEKQFKQGLIAGNLELLRKVPKGDCHNHSGLGMRYSTLNSWTGGKLTPPPQKMDGIPGLDRYISEVTMPYVYSRKGFEFMLEATIDAAVEDGVTLLETSIDCGNMTYYERERDFFAYICELVESYEGLVDFRPELGVARSMGGAGYEKLVVPCLHSGVFKSMDLYGDERTGDLNLFSKYFKMANALNMKTKVHVGEFGNPQYIVEAIEKLAPQEIQHGIYSAKDPKVMAMVKERGIRLNLCPSSNLRLGAVSSLEEYPIRELFEAGIQLTINTDDLLLFDSSVSEEYLLVYQAGLLGVDELNEIRLNSLR